jgi:hypothetical protein
VVEAPLRDDLLRGGRERLARLHRDLRVESERAGATPAPRQRVPS